MVSRADLPLQKEGLLDPLVVKEADHDGSFQGLEKNMESSANKLAELEELLAQERRSSSELQDMLNRERDNSFYWWRKSEEHWELYEKERVPWRLHVSSPATSLKFAREVPTSQGVHWRFWEVSCPCCRRPVDIALQRDEFCIYERQPYEDFREGTILRCASLPPGSQKLPIFASCTSFDVIRELDKFEVITAAGKSERVSNCPMVRVHPAGAVDARQFEIISQPDESDTACAEHEELGSRESRRYAYCACIWGAGGGYALGALVLGFRLQELSIDEESPPERVLLHTDDVPENFLEVLSKVWTLHPVDYIDAAEALYHVKGTCFDGVFTKLAAWTLVDYDKVLLLDIDTIALKSPYHIFSLEAPAAFVRGHCDVRHGDDVDGRRWFCGATEEDMAWRQGGGINAGVILLRPCMETFELMCAEVTAEVHPEHIPGAGPEQDYLSRFFAASPWHALSVGWNYQIHHVPFAMEHKMLWHRCMLKQSKKISQEDREWMPPRMKLDLDDIGIIHFSGDLKLWHLILDAKVDSSQRRAVEHMQSNWRHVAALHSFAEHLLRESCEGYERWFSREAPVEEYESRGFARKGIGDKACIYICEAGSTEDVTWLVDEMVAKIRSVSLRAVETWKGCLDRFLELEGNQCVVEKFEKPVFPAGCFALSERVEVCWPEWQQERWHPAMVVSVQKGGRHVVRYDVAGTWGDTERHVPANRIRSPAAVKDHL